MNHESPNSSPSSHALIVGDMHVVGDLRLLASIAGEGNGGGLTPEVVPVSDVIDSLGRGAISGAGVELGNPDN